MAYHAGLTLEEKLTCLFQPDTLLSTQYFERFCRKAYLDPEKKLMLTVLEDAIMCLQKYIHARDARGKTLFREAEGWILEEDSDWLFSFENICGVLGFNPQYVRHRLLRSKAKKLGHCRVKVSNNWINQIRPITDDTKERIILRQQQSGR